MPPCDQSCDINNDLMARIHPSFLNGNRNHIGAGVIRPGITDAAATCKVELCLGEKECQSLSWARYFGHFSRPGIAQHAPSTPFTDQEGPPLS